MIPENKYKNYVKDGYPLSISSCERFIAWNECSKEWAEWILKHCMLDNVRDWESIKIIAEVK